MNTKYDLDVVDAKYYWKKQLNQTDSLTFNECNCFGGYCKSKTINGIFVKCCENKATVKDYNLKENYSND